MITRARLLAVCLVLLGAGYALAQNAGVNPVVGSVWTYLGATYGAGWAVLPQLNTPISFGAVGNGISNDTAALQRAIDASGGKTLYLGPYTYCIGAPGLAVTHALAIVGDTPGYPWNNDNPNWGLKACALNVNILTFSGLQASGSKLSGVYFDSSGYSNTAGAAITVAGADFVEIDHVAAYLPCKGIDLRSGNQNKVDHAIIGAGGATHGCGGVTVGAASTGAASTDIKLDAITSYGSSDWGIFVADAGGLMIHNADLLYADRGLVVQPGLHQAVMWLFADNSALGDTTCQEGIRVDTADPTAEVTGLSFSNTWSSSAGGRTPGSCLGPGTNVQNTGGGAVVGVHFVGHRAYNNTREGFIIGANTSDVTIDASEICNNSVQTNTVPANHYDGIAVASGAAGFAIRNNRIGPSCAVTGLALQTTAINLYGGNFNLVITGNDLRNSTNPLLGATTAPPGPAVIKANLGLDDTVNGVAAASPLILSLFPTIALTGPTSVMSLVTGVWPGREVYLLARDAAQSFASGGTLSGSTLPFCNSRSITQGQVVRALGIGGFNCVYIFPP